MTDIDPSYWEPPDDDEAEDLFFEAFADAVREATSVPPPVAEVRVPPGLVGWLDAPDEAPALGEKEK